MAWYVYVAALFAGAFAANAVPHSVQGICGNRFQTPFASPPGRGESSALVNVLWGAANAAIASILVHVFFPREFPPPSSLCLLAGVGALLTALWLSHHFSRVRSNPPRP